MSKYLTSNSLVKSVLRRAMLPENNSAFKEEDILEFANEEMDLGVVPHVLSFHEDYFMQTFTTPIIQNEVRYEIPHRAMGNKLREVRLRDDSNNILEMSRIGVGDEANFQYSTIGFGATTLRTFSVQGSEIVLNAQPNSVNMSGVIEFFVYMRPSELVSESRSAKIVAIDNILGTITLDRCPDVFAGVTTFDITSKLNPHKIVGIDVVSSTVPTTSTPVLTFTSISNRINVGDIVCLSEETIIPQVPQEVHPILAQRAAIKCLEALGDTQGMQNAMAKLQEMEQKSGSILDARVEDAPQKVNNFHSFLKSSRKWTRR